MTRILIEGSPNVTNSSPEEWAKRQKPRLILPLWMPIVVYTWIATRHSSYVPADLRFLEEGYQTLDSPLFLDS